MFATMRVLALLTLVVLTCSFLSAQTQSAPTDESKPPSPAKLGNGVSPPKVLYNPDPEYSEKARKAKFQGDCVLWLVVGTDGTPHDIKVARSLGMGLDEKAIEAVKQWKFEPARKNGVPVAVQINVEVSFRLYGNPKQLDILVWKRRADAGDPEAQTELAEQYFKGYNLPKNPGHGMALLVKAARQGYGPAQFLLAEHLSPAATQGDEFVEAYMWYGLAQRHGQKAEKQMKNLESKMTPDQLAAARARIDAWQPVSAQ